MIKHAEYRYLGGENHYGLVKGKRYKLAIYKMSIFERLFSKYPVNWHIIAYRPFESGTCLMPYKNTDEFESYWSKVPQKCPESAPKTLIPSH